MGHHDKAFCDDYTEHLKRSTQLLDFELLRWGSLMEIQYYLFKYFLGSRATPFNLIS